MGFAVRKSKSRELAWTTEIVQDGMLFIANTLLSINHIHILTLITTVGLPSWFLALFSSFCIVYPMIRFWIVDMKFHLYYSWMHYLYQFYLISTQIWCLNVLVCRALFLRFVHCWKNQFPFYSRSRRENRRKIKSTQNNLGLHHKNSRSLGRKPQ